VAAWITSEVLKGDLAPSSCRWCSSDPLDARVRDALIWHDPAFADALSNVTGIVLMPLSAIGFDALAAAHDGTVRGVPEDALLIAEAAVVAADVNQLAKLIVGRERPFVHALPPEQKSLTPHPSDNNLSFFSGHSTEAFALATADKHWLTDVVVGAVVGAGIGFAVPYFFHSAVDDPPRTQASAPVRANILPIGTALTIAW
jgi:membrane-associated phospholipid phosphatase